MLMQKMVQFGGRLIGIVHRISHQERELLDVQKTIKILSIDQENKTQARHTDKTWPQKGAITAQNVKLRYRKDTELVLRGLNLNIKGGEKVGIVGRTGAGKSTLANALTRMTEICDKNDKEYDPVKDKILGNICFDGVNIGNINLEQVRESITIIPQEPTLFKGTMRFNMDPTGKISDADIEKVLYKAELDKTILKKKEESEKEKAEKLEKLANKDLYKDVQEETSLLDFKIDGGGGNLSSGEKALICICRAVLRKSKIVILDEATAAIDLKTEQLIQKVIEEEF